MTVLDQEQGLHRKLTSWQLTMIAIGGAIGVGLFLVVTIPIAGPGVLLSYILGAVVAVIMAYALAEMASVYPVVGSFGLYVVRYAGIVACHG